MKRVQVIATAGAALLLALLFAAPAAAAPTLSVQISRDQATINRGDEFASYVIGVENTSATDPTAGTLTVAVTLPQGMTLKQAGGSGWTCAIATQTCSSNAAVAPGASYPSLALSEVWIDETAPDEAIVGAIASGGGAAGDAFAEDVLTFGPAVPFGPLITDAKLEDESGADETQAGGHPFAASAVFKVGQRHGSGPNLIFPVEDLRGGATALPPGLVVNPEAAEAVCQFADLKANTCPDAAAVGGVKVFYKVAIGESPTFTEPLNEVVYRLPQEKGYPASFGFKTVGPAFVIRGKLRSDGDYGVSGLIPLVPQLPAVYGAKFTVCDFGTKTKQAGGDRLFDSCRKRPDPESNPRPFGANGTNCAAGQPLTHVAIDSWQHPATWAPNGLPDLTDPNWKTLDVSTPALTGCEALVEAWVGKDEPSFSLQPESHMADTPTAYTANLQIPQEGLEDPNGLATSHLKHTVVTLPPGLTFNPAIADGLTACSEQQIGLIGTGFPAPNRIHFDTKLPRCPDSSKIGTVAVRTPLLAKPLGGSVYLAAQQQNPFGSDYAIYLALEEPDLGIVAKLPGRVVPDPQTGRITTIVADNPQVPFSEFQLNFFGGARAPLANPTTCGSHTVETALTPWAAADPEHPLADEIARPSDQIAIDSAPNGFSCASGSAQRPFALELKAGSRDPVAGARSPFSLQISRPDGSQELKGLDISPPAGLAASLKGVPYCSEGQIKATEGNAGRAEQAGSTCPAASQIGTTLVGAGAGEHPFYAPGKVYLAGPYKGAPLSAVAVTPAVAGPFDLGVVVVRSALFVNSTTARITAKSDPIPDVVRGVPLRIRDVRIALDRADWTFNPTSCDPSSVDVRATSVDGAVRDLSSRFQVGGCSDLGFSPKLQFRLKGGTHRGDHPALTATLSQPSGQANIGFLSAALPHSQFLDQAHIRTVCTRVQFAAEQCPAGSVYGRAEAVTPLLDQPLQGNVYLRSSSNPLPDLVIALRGPASQPIAIDVVGRIDSVNGGIRNTFDFVPDAPVSDFVLRMKGGGKGLLINSRNLCKGPAKVAVRFVGQNGKQAKQSPKLNNSCGEKKPKKNRVGRHRRARATVASVRVLRQAGPF